MIAVLAAERDVALQHRRVARARARRDRRAFDHPVAPDLGRVLRAPDVARLVGRVAAEDRIQEGVDGDVLDLLQVALELLAVAAVRVGEDDQLARAAALLPDDRVLQRQLREVDRGQLRDAGLGQVRAGLRVDQAAFDQVVALLVGVQHLGADPQLVDAGDRRLRDLVDLRKVGQPLGDALADGRFIGHRELGRQREHGGRKDRDEMLGHGGFQEPRAWLASQRLAGGKLLTRVRPRLRSSRSADESCENRRNRPSVTSPIAQVGAARSRA